MKKLLVVGLLIFGITVGAFAVYADSADINESSFTRGFGHKMGSKLGFNKAIDLTDKEKDELIQNRKDFFEKQQNLTEEERQELIIKRQKERSEYREERIKESLEDGTITEEQATKWRTHFAEMDKFHEESGFIGGGCHSKGMGKGSGRGNAMMGGNRL